MHRTLVRVTIKTPCPKARKAHIPPRSDEPE
jgi:hypothetical protein